MTDAKQVKSLADLFRKLGAQDPESWARSEIEEGIPQLLRFLFLRQAWRNVISDDDASWIDRAIARAQVRPDEPYAGVGHALKSLRARGATDREIIDLVRGMQAELLFRFCYLLSDPGDLEPEVAEVGWALVELSENGEARTIDGLHESVLETDPTGREMRPAGRAG